jgi:UDP-N-acetylglucosamine--N-acetylmuramyl-(pentapeptide) pyrophosphoryl-undecaprenol N-acetylglucosamine transferase
VTWTGRDQGLARLVIAGGGTGGHLYPGIAVARETLRRYPSARVSFVGTARGLERRIVPAEGFELDCIRSAGLKGKSWWARLRGAALVPLGLVDAWHVLTRRRPQAVVGVGGYSSGPVVLMASLRGIATMVLEQNAVPGLTNRLLARRVRAAAVAYEATLSYFGGRGFVAGNPVRPEFLAAADAGGRAGVPATGPRVLAMGGSQGARAINRAMTAAAAAIVAAAPGVAIVHQTGERDLADARERYAAAGVAARVESFIDPMAPEMAGADLVVCRAGATTLAELAALGRPAVLVPFPAATDDHQRRNAAVLAGAGAAIVIDERDLTGERLASTVAALLADRGRLERMGQAMRGLARPDAAARIVDRLEGLVVARG